MAKAPKIRTPLTQKRLRELLEYNPESGEFRWRMTGVPANRVKAGEIAGSFGALGYRDIQIDGWPYRSGRLAWLWMMGRWPANEIDHSNLDRADDSWNNLRPATRAQNCANRKAWRKGKGVTFHHGRYRARIADELIGYFDTEKEALAAYAARAKQLYGEFARPD